MACWRKETAIDSIRFDELAQNCSWQIWWNDLQSCDLDDWMQWNLRITEILSCYDKTAMIKGSYDHKRQLWSKPVIIKGSYDQGGSSVVAIYNASIFIGYHCWHFLHSYDQIQWVSYVTGTH